MAGWSDGWLLLFGGRIDGDGWMGGLMDVWWVGGWSFSSLSLWAGLGCSDRVSSSGYFDGLEWMNG